MAGDASGSTAFWWKLSDNAFRRLVWLLLPVVLLTGVGVLQASKTLELYRSTGVLSAARNPLVPDQEISGATTLYWESPADSTSRILNERLRTDSFVDEVTARAGLQEAIEDGLVHRETIREHIGASASGSSIVNVSATWADAPTSQALATAAIAVYQEFLANEVASDASQAEQFYTEQLAKYEADVEAARSELTDYVESLPPVSDPDLRSADVQLRIEQLGDALRDAQSKVSATRGNIEAAQLAVAQSRSEAGSSLSVIDEPLVPSAPESKLMSKAVTVLSFFLLSVVVAVAALLVTTALDHTVASPHDLTSIGGISIVTTVPRVRALQAAGNGTRKRRSGSPDEALAHTEPIKEKVTA